MINDYKLIANKILETALAIGNCELDLKQGIESLESGVASACRLESITEMWQITQESNSILRILYPEHAEIFSNEDPRAPADRDAIPIHISTKVLIRQVLCGVQTLDKLPERVNGATELLDAYPSPIPPSGSPFADDRGVWDHTHGCEEDG